MTRIKKFIRHHFPTYGVDNVYWFYVVNGLGNSWFQIGNWLLFILLFISAQEFAVYEAIAFALAIALEIPSGAIADLLGKRKTTIMGYAVIALGAILFTLAFLGAATLFIGNILIIAGFALISGSLEALVYDSLVEVNKTDHYDEIIGKAHSIEIGVMVVAGLIGGVAWSISTYLPWILTASMFVITAILSFKLREPSVDTEKYSFSNFIKQNKRGFHYLFKSKFRKYTFSIAAITGTYLMWGMGIVRVIMGRDFGYDGESINYLIAATLAVSFVTAYLFKKIRKFLGDRLGYSLMLLFATVGWLLASEYTNSVYIGAFVFVLLTVSGSLTELWNSVILNAHVHSKDRATALSTLSFLVQIPYVLVVIVFAQSLENQSLSGFYLTTGLILALATVIYYLVDHPRRKPKKS